MDLDQRIAQFETMTQADAENEMAHYSLGGAYMEAERYADAAGSYQRCVEIVPDMSKAYQMAGEALTKAGEADEAGKILERGYVVAAAQGDLMPKQAIGRLLEQLGRPLPQVASDDDSAEQLQSTGAFKCKCTGKPGNQMDQPPFKGPIGQWIRENISRETFDEWIGQGTKVINELRLDLSREEDSQTYDRYMYEYLGIDETLRAGLTQAHAKG